MAAELLTGTVFKSTGSWYEVKTDNGTLYDCRVPGIFRLGNQIKATNPIAVGDHVKIEVENENSATALIREILDRKNYLIRKASKMNSKVHILASNIDCALIFYTIKQPRTSEGFLSRFLVTCDAYDVPVFIVWNKIDLLNSKDLDKLEELKSYYSKLGFENYAASMLNEKDAEYLKEKVKNKVSLLFGHSGTGKSTFLNRAYNIELQTSELSKIYNKGKHTTTFSAMYEFDVGTRIIDTPGIREFGLSGFESNEISHFFREMKDLAGECKFSNCRHITEPGCKVREAYEAGEIREKRYMSYCSMLEEVEESEKEY